LKISARNQLKGTVKKISHGAINSEITIEIAPRVEVIAQITSAAVANLGLKEGMTAYAIIKADSVMVGVD
jgi:molybdopterin-binding protein